MAEENKQLNIVAEKFVVRLTEWEKDCLLQGIEACTFPGSLVPLASRLITKIKSAEEVNVQENTENPENK